MVPPYLWKHIFHLFVVDKFDNEPFQAQFMVLKPDLNFQCPLYILSMEAKYDIKVSAFSSDDELYTPASTFQIVAVCALFDTIHENYS